jgi:hypothetical protein
VPPNHKDNSKIDWSLVRSSFNLLVDNKSDSDSEVELDDVLNGKTSYAAPLEKARIYAERLDAASGAGHVFINGKHFDLDDVCVFIFYFSVWNCC